MPIPNSIRSRITALCSSLAITPSGRAMLRDGVLRAIQAAAMLMAALAAIPAVLASGGAMELSLDRAAVVSLVGTAMPEAIEVSVARFGTLALRPEPPASVVFVSGGIEATVILGVDELELRVPVRVRYVPEVEPLEGIVRLRAESAVPDIPLPFVIDLAALLPVVDLPRALSWSIRSPRGEAIPLRCTIQGLQVGEDRLVIALGLVPGRVVSSATPGGGR